MTAAREAFVLPFLFITVAALGGLRVRDTIQLLPPPLSSLVLAVLLCGAFFRTGVLAPQHLLGPRRSGLENLSGAIVIVTLFMASAQVIALVTPETGLLHAIFTIALFVQIATSLAGISAPRPLLRSLAVLLGCAFVLRFVVLDALYASDGGWAKTIVTGLMEGATLGAISYQPTGTLTGYLAFVVLILYLVGLMLLPWGAPTRALIVREFEVPSKDLMAAVVAIALLASAGCTSAGGAGSARDDDAAKARLRDDALTRARVWSQPATPIGEFDFTANPPSGFAPTDDVSCEFTVQNLNGRTPKFHCKLADGRIVKVKYGAYNAELQAEIAGTRLLHALGFPADDMFAVHSVRCAGCPRYPFEALLCHEKFGLSPFCFSGAFDVRRVRVFAPVVIERRMPGTEIEGRDDEGWSWFELDRIDPARGGSSRAEVDGLRLLAMVLAHWDNKGPNQRLLCPEGKELPGGGCSEPVAMIQDVGATFGPNRVDLQNWRATPVWRDRKTCTVSMSGLPYGGATFVERQISEGGRQFLGGLLGQLTDRQMIDLFTAARFVDFDEISAEAQDARAWVKAFREKINAVRDGPPCSS